MSNEYTMTEIAEKINIAPDQVRLYTGHYTLSKYVIRTYKNKSYPSMGIDISQDFITDFIKYLNSVKKRGFKEERTKFIKKQLEMLLPV